MSKRKKKQRGRTPSRAEVGRKPAAKRAPHQEESGASFLNLAQRYERSRNIRPALLWLLFALTLALPQFFGVKAGGYCGLHPAAPACGAQWPLLDNIGTATAYIADEPHYMTIVSSVINDGDLDLKNNYAAAHAGGFDSGARFRAFPLNHHAYYYLPEGYTWWDRLVKTGADGHHAWVYADESRQGITFEYRPEYQHIAELPEYSWHPPFIAVLGYPFLRPFKDSQLLEPAAIFMGYLATLLAAAFTYWCLGKITPSVLTRFAAVSVIFLASPVWHYSRKLLTEPYLAAFLIIAFACFFRGRSFATRYLIAPAFIGLAMTMKSYAVLAMLPLYYLSLREQWRAADQPLMRRLLPLAAISIGPFIGGCTILYWHTLQTGHPFIFPAGSATAGTAEGYTLTPSVFFPTIFNMLFALQWGLLWFCPALVPAAYGWWQLLKKHGNEATVALFMALPYFLLFAFYTGTRDGVNYGPRYMTAILPLLLIGIIGFLMHARLTRASTWLLWALLIASFLINAPAAIGSWMFGTRHPIEALF